MATPWRAKRPQLDPDAAFSTALPPVPDPEPAQIDAATRDRVAVACRAAGLTLTERQFDMVCAAAPYVIAMTGRLYRDRAYGEEPADVFQFAG
jgi:aspartyl-tRNA(Asn)/glutamyl-tRNA(Gln) amidotransferase subunit A